MVTRRDYTAQAVEAAKSVLLQGLFPGRPAECYLLFVAEPNRIVTDSDPDRLDMVPHK